MVSSLTALGLPDVPVITRADVLWGGRQLAIQWRDGNTPVWPVTLALARESHQPSQPPGLPGPPTRKDQNECLCSGLGCERRSVGLLTLIKDIYKFILSTGVLTGARCSLQTAPH